MRTLISFLGKGRDSVHTGYRTARYQFGPGQCVETPFFGLTLAKHEMPDRLILLGTSGSMWDIFALAEGEKIDSALSDELIDAVAGSRVDQNLLDRVAQATYHDGGMRIELVLIPYARTEDEQIQVLSLLAARVAPAETVLIDVTHGYRHLPMLALVAARYLAEARGARIEQIFYGALEMTPAGGPSPVLKLGGLLHLLDWVHALAAHDSSGDYGAFAGLAQRDGLSSNDAQQIERAAFFERTTNPVLARQAVVPLLGRLSELGGATGLFSPQLQERLKWVRPETRDEWELALHRAYLDRGDYLRAAIYLQESAISRKCRARGVDQNQHASREDARDLLKDQAAFRALSDVRNMLAHGSISGPGNRAEAARQCIESPGELRNALTAWRKQLTR